MLANDDTIAAISTPLGEGGIGIVRVSGRDAIAIVENIFRSPTKKQLGQVGSYRLTYGYIVDPVTGEKIDETIVSVMKSPHSYTREDVVEINCHSGTVTLMKILNLTIRQGARLATPGEFTKRAFLNGRIDLSQAEAVIDLIRSKTDESRRIALEQLQGGLSEKISSARNKLTDVCVAIEAYIDFPEDEIEVGPLEEFVSTIERIRQELRSLVETYDDGRLFREGLLTAIVGRPNVGKSSLLNALLRKDRAIVTEFPGTTRDVIEEYLNIRGLPLRILDTAGIRKVDDAAEREGVRRSLQSIEHADLILALFDRSVPLQEEDYEVLRTTAERNTLFILNKSDLPPALDAASLSPWAGDTSRSVLAVSATRGDGIDALKEAIFHASVKNWREGREGDIVTNVRHKNALEAAADALAQAQAALSDAQPLEIVALELREALAKLGEIVGFVTTEDILERIFNEFCIGK